MSMINNVYSIEFEIDIDENSILIRPVLCQLVLQCIIKTRHKCIHSADINAFILQFLNIHNAYMPWVLTCDFKIKVEFVSTLWYHKHRKRKHRSK